MYNDLSPDNRVYLIYCDIGNYRHWVKDSINAEKFFCNFDKLIVALKELTTIDYEFLEPTPLFELRELQENEQKYYQAFLAKSWAKTLYEMAKLKTESGKKNKANKFRLSLKPYENRFSNETLYMLENSDFSNVDIDYANKHLCKTDKDQYFIFQTDNKIKNLTEHDLLYSSGCNKDDYIFYINNSHLLTRLIGHFVDDGIFKDLCKLYFIYQDYNKIERYLTIKYNIEDWFAKLLSLSPSRIMCAHRDYRELQYQYKHYPEYDNKYFISTHNAPCEKCQEHRGKIYNIRDAKIGVNFPPFCSHGCSKAFIYIKGITEINQKPLSYPDELFAKALNLYEDGKYKEAAEQGLDVCLMVPESERYIQYVPEMLAKVKRYEEAVQILNNYIELNKNVRENYVKQRNRYQKQIK